MLYQYKSDTALKAEVFTSYVKASQFVEKAGCGMIYWRPSADFPWLVESVYCAGRWSK